MLFRSSPFSVDRVDACQQCQGTRARTLVHNPGGAASQKTNLDSDIWRLKKQIQVTYRISSKDKARHNRLDSSPSHDQQKEGAIRGCK